MTFAKNMFIWLIECAFYCILFLLVHYLVLRYIFPGFYDPFWPCHSDLYMPASLANTFHGLAISLSYPRPIGFSFYWLIGHLGIRGSIFVSFLVIGLNYSFIVALLRHSLKMKYSWLLIFSILIYAFLLVSHPSQYSFPIQDGFAQLSLFFLLLAFTIFLYSRQLWLALIFTLCSFLAKETYIVSVFFLSLVWLFYNYRFNKWRALVPLIIICIAVFIMLIYNYHTHSVFANGSNSVTDTYYVVLRPISVLHEWGRYLDDGINIIGFVVIILLLLLPIFMNGLSSKISIITLSLVIAGILAYLPNSVLPNHHFNGYSWNGAYLLFAPILLTSLYLNAETKFLRLASIITLACALITPVFSSERYAKSNWDILQQKRQKILMQDLSKLISSIHIDRPKILVLGLNFPFNPFDHEQAMMAFKPPVGTEFYVVNYNVSDISYKPDICKNEQVCTYHISLKTAETRIFDEVWLIKSDGSLLKRMNYDQMQKVNFTYKDLVQNITLYPDLLAAFEKDSTLDNIRYLNSTQYLNYGVILLSYHALSEAEYYLKKSNVLMPENPYPYFYLGKIYVERGMIRDAKISFQKAILLDHNHENPSFNDALNDISSQHGR